MVERFLAFNSRFKEEKAGQFFRWSVGNLLTVLGIAGLVSWEFTVRDPGENPSHVWVFIVGVVVCIGWGLHMKASVTHAGILAAGGAALALLLSVIRYFVCGLYAINVLGSHRGKTGVLFFEEGIWAEVLMLPIFYFFKYGLTVLAAGIAGVFLKTWWKRMQLQATKA